MKSYILKARKRKNLTLEVSIRVLGIVGSLVGTGVLILGTPSCTNRHSLEYISSWSTYPGFSLRYQQTQPGIYFKLEYLSWVLPPVSKDIAWNMIQEGVIILGTPSSCTERHSLEYFSRWSTYPGNSPCADRHSLEYDLSWSTYPGYCILMYRQTQQI